MLGDQATIAAIATPLGAGGIGVVRISGPCAVEVAERVFRPRGPKELAALPGYTGLLGRVFDGEGELDDAIAFLYRAPRSYTGEDVVEISCHGGVWPVQNLLRLCLEGGAVPAAPGEFTKRAFLNGKMSLADAEAVVDLIGAQGEAAMRAALSARDGALSTEIAQMVENLLAQSAHLAAWADYPEEEIEPVDRDQLRGELAAICQRIDRLLATWTQGKILREGARTVIVGRPNVGKSTLMNLLAGEERSIVTEHPGTTRDIVEDCVRVGSCRLLLADTAGIRKTSDPVEQIGVSRAEARIDSADLILAVFDSSDPLTEEDHALLGRLWGKPCIAVLNKSDLPKQLDAEEIARCIPEQVALSAQTGQGEEALAAAVERVLRLDTLDTSAAMVFSQRQRLGLLEARGSLEEAAEALASGMMLDAVNVSIDYALDALLALTGQRVSDAVVDEVFARFCVGK